MIEEPFAEGTTPLHKMDAAAKVVAAVIIVLPAATTERFQVIAGFAILSLILATIARLPVRQVIKRLILVNTFTLFLLLTLPFTFGGEQKLLFSLLPVSVEGTRLALLIGVKTNTILIAMMALLNTSNLSALGYGLEKLGLPLRLCYLVLFSYRYIFVIEQEYRRLLRAARMRCFAPSTNIHTYRTFGYLFGMTLVKSWEQAHRVHQAMILRGFSGRFIPLSVVTIDFKSYLLITMVALYSLILVWLEYFPS
jgi:cobalt/nickel transport system permease protein